MDCWEDENIGKCNKKKVKEQFWMVDGTMEF